MDDVVEKVRMCVAEAGYDPMWIEPAYIDGFYFNNIMEMIPHDICWRAREICYLGEPKCLRCSLEHRNAQVDRECRAVRRLELDCGAYTDKENA